MAERSVANAPLRLSRREATALLAAGAAALAAPGFAAPRDERALRAAAEFAMSF